MCVQIRQGRACSGERRGGAREVAGAKGGPAFDQEATGIACFRARPRARASEIRLPGAQESDRLLLGRSPCPILNGREEGQEGRNGKEVPHVNTKTCIAVDR